VCASRGSPAPPFEPTEPKSPECAPTRVSTPCGPTRTNTVCRPFRRQSIGTSAGEFRCPTSTTPRRGNNTPPPLPRPGFLSHFCRNESGGHTPPILSSGVWPGGEGGGCVSPPRILHEVGDCSKAKRPVAATRVQFLLAAARASARLEAFSDGCPIGDACSQCRALRHRRDPTSQTGNQCQVPVLIRGGAHTCGLSGCPRIGHTDPGSIHPHASPRIVIAGGPRCQGCSPHGGRADPRIARGYRRRAARSAEILTKRHLALLGRLRSGSAPPR
jgi:hypothetical protein